MSDFLPPHLKKYVVEQNYEKYTPIDQACWRYILRQLKAFLSVHAHECYLDGLEKTGIDIEQIPHISDISAKIEKFGWRALPVSGFIPPAAFMELQSLSILPIASDMRSLEHLMYTPAPDIVHEAAGHAPILVHPEFAEYLKKYSQVAKKAILSKEDLNLYEAIRELSDTKESPHSSPEDIKRAEENLERVSQSISYISEGSELSRMNWWTAEYGLIGDLKNPKIFGAGLLSSVGESRWCLSDKVKKLPLTVDCIKQSYDITEPQPQLFVSPDFATLSAVLDDMANLMAFKRGGAYGLDKAIKAKTVNTVEFDSGLQISGVISEYFEHQGEVSFVKLAGPTQLSYADKELSGHSKDYHAHGYSTPIGVVREFNKPLSQLNSTEIASLKKGDNVQWTYVSGITVNGRIASILTQSEQLLSVALEDCSVQLGDKVLFAPDWGTFDLAAAGSIPSVFGGPADRLAYGELDDFVAKRVPQANYSKEQKELFNLYAEIRNLRQSTQVNLQELSTLTQKSLHYPTEWLAHLELTEIYHLKNLTQDEVYRQNLNRLAEISQKYPQYQQPINDGIKLVDKNL